METLRGTYSDLLRDNLEQTPAEAMEMIHAIIVEAIAIGCDDPVFWDLANELLGMEGEQWR